MGTYSIDPRGEILCGSYGTWTIVYTVGRYGMDNGAVLCLSASGNWGGLQTRDPEGPN